MNKKEYAEYLKSEHWKRLRGEKHKRARRGGTRALRCAVCASTEQIHTHHLQYKSIYDVLTSDLRLLCERCHTKAHELLASGELSNCYRSHHGMFAALKCKVKKALGLSGKNLFYPPKE